MKLHVRVIVEQDVDGRTQRALELLSRQDAQVGLDERVEGVADDEAEVFEAHAVDALVERRYQLDETDVVALADRERLLEEKLRNRPPVLHVLEVGGRDALKIVACRDVLAPGATPAWLIGKSATSMPRLAQRRACRRHL